MSAIAGVWTRTARIQADAYCAKILAAQALYGPHAVDSWSDEAFAIGRRLHRLLPEDAYDRQPRVGGGGRFVLVADLRLDNRGDLQGELGIDALRADQISDADLLLAAWERWTEECFDHLVGDYAFAVWDRDRQRLALARDPFGARPLHFHRGEGFFAFSSMPKGLLALPETPMGPDESRALDCLALARETGSQTFFKGIERVEPGQILTVTPGGLRATTHWRPKREPIRLRSIDDYAEALRSQLDRAVAAQLRGAGRQVAAQLSGGLDSSSVAATAARLMASAGGRVVAFTSVPREGYCGPSRPWEFGDEGPLAAETVALYPNVEHVLARSGGKSPLDSLDRDFYLYDRPTTNPNALWGNEIFRLAKERGLSVLLVGTAGNIGMSYGGLGALCELAGRGRFRSWLRIATALRRNGILRWRGILYRSVDDFLPNRLWAFANQVMGKVGHDFVGWSALNPARRADVVRRLGAAGGPRAFYRRGSPDAFETRIEELTWTDPGNFNKGALGGWDIDVRDPTSDRRLIEFCLNVPTEVFIHGGVPRGLARIAMSDRLPTSVVDERRRGHLGIDWHEGFEAARAQIGDMVARLDSCPSASFALDIQRMRRLVDNWPTGGWERDDVAVPYRLALLRGLAVGHFLLRASGSNA